MSTLTLHLDNLPRNHLNAIKRRARELGVTPSSYVSMLIENDIEHDDLIRNSTFAELAAPLRDALVGVTEEELDRRVDAAHPALQAVCQSKALNLVANFSTPRIVIDTNVLLRAIANRASASGMIVSACERRIMVVLLSKPVVVEYLTVLSDQEVVTRHTAITTASIENTLKRLRYVGDKYERTPRFEFPRDPRDAPFLELAIAGHATHLITVDKDLLSLPASRTDAGKRFRQRLASLHMQTPADFVHAHSRLLGQ